MLWQQTRILAQTMSPQTEKACSDGTEVAGIARQCQGQPAQIGVSQFVFILPFQWINCVIIRRIIYVHTVAV